MYDGTLKFDTKIDSAGMQKDGAKLSSIVKGLGVFKILETGLKAVADSVGEAVSRVDALEQFPKVMTQMGYAAKDAEDGINRLSDGVQGLPTTLDGITSSARQLIVATGDLDTGVDSALALNNAFLASGAGVADAERGLTQYVQMLSSGKADQQSWLTLQQTMTYALNETAEAFGFVGASATQDLRQALMDGEITMTEFNAKMIELSTTTGGFAEVAKTSTGGIATSWANVKTAVVKGVADVIDAVDGGLDSFGGISGAMDSVKAGVSSSFKVISAGAKGLLQNLDKLAIGAAGVVAAFAAHKGITAWSAASQTAQTVAAQLSKTNQQLTIAVNGVALSQKQQAAVQATATAESKRALAEKLRLVAAEKQAEAAAAKEALTRAKGGQILTAQTTAIKTHTVASNANATAKLAEMAAEDADTAATVANTAAQNAQNTSVGLGTALIGYLTGSLTGHQLVTAVSTAVTTAFGVALKALPLIGVAAAVGAVVAATIMFVKSFRDGSEEMQEARKQAEELKKEQEELAQSIEDASKARKEAIDSIENEAAAAEKLYKRVEELAAKNDGTAESEYRLKAAIDAFNASMPEAILSYNKQTKAVDGLNEETERYIKNLKAAALAKAYSEQAVEIAREQTDAELKLLKVRAEMLDMRDKGLASKDKQVWDIESAQWITEQSEEATDAYALLLESEAGYVRDVKSARNDLDMIGELSADHMAENAEKVAEATTKTGETIADLAKEYGVADEAIQSFLDSGGTMDEWVEQQEAAIQRHEENMQSLAEVVSDVFNRIDERSELSAGQMVNNLEHNLGAMERWSDNLATLTERGLDEGYLQKLRDAGPASAGEVAAWVNATEGEIEKFNDLYGSVGEESVNAYLDSFNGAKSDAEAAGSDLSGEAAKGVSESDAVPKAAEQMISNAQTSANNAVTNADFPGVGKNIAEGLAQGIRDGIPDIEAASSEAVQAGEAAAKSTGQIQSPSKLFRNEIGRMVAKGFALGIQDGIPEAEKAANDLANSVYKKATDAIADRKYYGKLSNEEELATLKKMAKQFKKYGDIKKQINQDIYRVEAEIRKESYQKDKAAIDEAVKYNNLTLQDQLKAWEAVQKKYKKGTDERIDAEKEIARVKREITEEINDLEEKYQKALEDRTKQLFKSYSLFEKVEKRQAVSGKQLIKNLESQIEATQKWQNGLDSLSAKGVNKDLIEELREMGPKANEEIAALLRMSDEELQKYSNLYGEKQKQANVQAKKELEGLRKQTDEQIGALLGKTTSQLQDGSYAAGQEMVLGLIDGINSKTPTLLKEVENLGSKVIKATKLKLKISSPSKVFRDDIGAMLTAGFVQGVAENTKSVVKAVTDQMQAAKEAAESSPLARLEASSPLIKEFLSLSEETIQRYAQQLQAASMVNQAAVARAPAMAVAGGGVVYNQKFEQTNYSPEPISPAANARAAEAMLRRQKWQIP